MSRFLDAMRDRGKPDPDGEESRAYRGSVVDASEVLGSADQLTLVDENSTTPEQPRRAAVDHSYAADRPRAPYPETTPPKVDHPSTSTAQTSRSGESAVDSPDYGQAMPESMAGDNRGYQAGGPSAYREPRGFRLRLDPLFYLIIGIAAAGLFICLYALITQNDAYFEREYQQLQKESAALQARLAASAELQADLFAANKQSMKNSAPSETVATVVEQNDQQTDVSATAAAAPVESAPAATSVPDVVADDSAEKNSLERIVTEPGLISAAEATPDNPVSPALVLLQQEVEILRNTLSRQEQIINRLERDNRELNTSRVKAILKQHEQEPLPEFVLPGKINEDTAISDSAEVAQVVPQRRVESNAVAPVVSTVTPSLARPTQNASEEVSDLIRQGYLAYQSKDYNASASFYGKALEFDPYNRDANLGVAAIAQLNGDARLAEDRYRHLLTLNPADEVAFSALLGLSGGGQGSIIEFELLQHVENIREAPALHGILGNYYSHQKRWRKASESYAVALNGGAVNPDYLFNYAVSLDNEGRSDQAAEYYSQALAAMQSAPFSFDAEAAKQRLESLREPG